MLSQMKWVRTGMSALLVAALLSGVALAKKPPKDPPPPPPEPDPPPVTYMITWLDEFEINWVQAMNSYGHVVGSATTPDLYGGEPFAWVYTPETGMVDLNTLLPDGNDWFLPNANDINDKGQIVGYGFRSDSDTGRGWRYTPALLDENGDELLPAVIEEIASPSVDDQKTVASRINENGEVAGNTVDASGVSHVWWFSDVVGVVPLAGGGTKARGLNESSQVLVEVSDPFSRPIRVLPFGEPEDFVDVYCSHRHADINDSGEFVGWTTIEVPINKKRTRTVTRAIRHDGVNHLDLGAGDDSFASAINNYGDVVGFLPPNSYSTTRGFVYLEDFQQLVRLDDAIVGDTVDVAYWLDPGVHIYPSETNNAGHISGELVSSGFYYSELTHIGFILTPVP